MEDINYVPFELEPSWKAELKEELTQPYLRNLALFVEKERASGIPVYPPKDLVFNAFWQTPYNAVKVVIMGQDPYHGPGQACGMSFSVPKGVPQPPSLQNIFKELNADLGTPIPHHGCLLSWARQGVLLLNASLTVSKGEPQAHKGKGWERFSDAVIAKLCQRPDPVVFVLWGKSAQEKVRHISTEAAENQQHMMLKAPHPSPFSAHYGFLGCRHFSKINNLLLKHGKTPIDWRLDKSPEEEKKT